MRCNIPEGYDASIQVGDSYRNGRQMAITSNNIVNVGKNVKYNTNATLHHASTGLFKIYISAYLGHSFQVLIVLELLFCGSGVSREWNFGRQKGCRENKKT